MDPTGIEKFGHFCFNFELLGMWVSIRADIDGWSLVDGGDSMVGGSGWREGGGLREEVAMCRD